MPPVSIDDGQSLLTSRLWYSDNSSLLRSSKGLSFVHLFLDPTIVDPRHSDPMAQICTSPLCFLWSLDVDLMVIQYSELVIQQPLSFFLLSFRYSKCSKVSTFSPLAIPSFGPRLHLWKNQSAISISFELWLLHTLEVWFIVVLSINDKHILPVKHANI
jgi:hypothetical protein